MSEQIISIVIATYNGTKYLRQQLDSILSNDSFDSLVKEIIISDDNSVDGTRELIENYKLKYPIISLITNSSQGVKSNFLNGMNFSSGKYIVLCDQDDIWESNKLNVLFNEITELESKGDSPGLVFSDSTIVDDSLNTIHESFFGFNKLNIDSRLSVNSLILKNVCQGCVIIFNRELLTYLNQTNEKDWVMHDWAIMIIALKKGKISFVFDKLIKYRIHGGNAVGAKKVNLAEKVFKIRKELSKYDDYINLVFIQAVALKKANIIENNDHLTFSDWYKAENSNLRKLVSLVRYRKIKEKINQFNKM